jgi:hypothetical protein
MISMQRAFLRQLSGAFLGAALVGLTPLAAQAQTPLQTAPSSNFEMAGIRLGMTEAEARAAIRAFDPTLRITSVMGVFNYNDGVNHALRTPEFLDRLEAVKGNQLPSLKVYFSGPVGEVRVIGVHRSEIVTTNPPTAAQFAQTLINTYGRPAGVNGMNNAHIVWAEAGRPTCIRARNHVNQVALSVSSGTSLMENSAVEDFYTKRGSEITARGLLPADLTQCGAYIDYNLIGDPVRQFVAEMNDLGAMVTAERSRKAWVQQLQDAATRQRQSQGQTPRL